MEPMQPLFSVANEAYQGESAIEPIIKAISKAQKLYPTNEHAATKELEKMTQYIEKIFNFKNCTLQVNNTTWWFGATTSVGRFTIGNGDTKLITNEDFEQAVNTYRFKKPIVNCNLSLYAPNILNAKRINPREVTALIVREIGYSFFAWGKGRIAEEAIRNTANVAMTLGDRNVSLEKVATQGCSLALDYAPTFKFRATSGSKSGFLSAIHSAFNAVTYAGSALLMPILGVINLILLPFTAIKSTIDKFFGISFDEVDKFADAFAASYGLGADLATAMEKERDMLAIGGKRLGGNYRLFADITGASIALYTISSGKCGATNTGAVLPRIDTLAQYYEDLLKEQKNPKIKKEIKDKLKALQIEREYLNSLPRETLTPGALIAKLWTNLFGSETEGIDRLDRDLKKSK